MEIVINDLKVNYIEEGEGDVILMLHGWASNSQLYRSQIDLLKSKSKLISLFFSTFFHCTKFFGNSSITSLMQEYRMMY